MEFLYNLQKRCRIETRRMRWLMIVGVMAFSHLLFQSLLLPYENAIKSLLPGGEVPNHGNYNFPINHSSTKAMVVRNPLTINASNFSDASVIVDEENDDEYLGDEDLEHDGGLGKEEREIVSEVKGLDNTIEILDSDVDGGFPSENPIDKNQRLLTDGVKSVNNSVLKLASEAGHGLILPKTLKPDQANYQEQDPSVTPKKLEDVNTSSQSPPSTSSTAASASMSKPPKKKIKCEIPPTSVTSIQEMNRILERRRASSRAMRPRWSSARDQEILAAKLQIEQTHPVVKDMELYAPVFRNVSKFIRSYELMERVLKVYVYKDGNKPVFHQPILKGLYASEGWFMKLMEGNKHFVVKDPRRAHLFYMPFSSRMLEYTIYVRNSHNRTNLRQYLKDYTEKIAAKYPYFNRTGGSDHFLVACHDWAPYETRHHMERCIKALCNADVTVGFKIGRDVSLPETYVRSARNPLRSLGGLPPSRRHILAFYAGSMHGYLRPILVKHWKDKDPRMKIFGPMPAGVASKLSYIQHMKSSKYCLCPKGYEVNSPRVVEAIFYECVPVIISDNFVPPFFEVLDWNAFSIIIAEKDIPNLKDILLSIPEKKYLEMQLAVRKVQRHFLWHAKPLKYDLFYMTLHSIWYNRVYQVKAR